MKSPNLGMEECLAKQLPTVASTTPTRRLAFFDLRRLVLVVLSTLALTHIAIFNISRFTHRLFPSESHDNPFEHLRSHCAHTKPISSLTFLARQAALAQVFANISLAEWKLSERVFLIVVTPTEEDEEGQVSVLAPKFEKDRARLLEIPSKRPVRYITWAEEESPYEALLATLGKDLLGQGVVADEGLRLFVSEGLKRAGGQVDVKMAPPSVRALRERKGAEEIALMRCANEVTLMAIRAVRERMYIGIRESQVKSMMNLALSTAGLKNAFALVQFGENAALPHGSGSDRTLRVQDMVLIDTGGSLHNYESDVTRTFALPESVIPEKHARIWETVSMVQAHALNVARKGVEARSVDDAARVYMDSLQAGTSKYFSHRLGHGIGLEGHEAPYLRRGADNRHELAPGNTMSDEPGIYILGEVGVRLEDCFYISEDGNPELLTSGAGGFARGLLDP